MSRRRGALIVCVLAMTAPREAQSQQSTAVESIGQSVQRARVAASAVVFAADEVDLATDGGVLKVRKGFVVVAATDIVSVTPQGITIRKGAWMVAANPIGQMSDAEVSRRLRTALDLRQGPAFMPLAPDGKPLMIGLIGRTTNEATVPVQRVVRGANEAR